MFIFELKIQIWILVKNRTHKLIWDSLSWLLTVNINIFLMNTFKTVKYCSSFFKNEKLNFYAQKNHQLTEQEVAIAIQFAAVHSLESVSETLFFCFYSLIFTDTSL